MNKTRKHIENLVDFANYDSVDDFGDAIDKMEAIKNKLDAVISFMDESEIDFCEENAIYSDICELYDAACFHVRNWNAYERIFGAARTEVYS